MTFFLSSRRRLPPPSVCIELELCKEVINYRSRSNFVFDASPWTCFRFLKSFQGYVLGNPATFLHGDGNYAIPFAHAMGLISDELYEVYI